VAAASRVTRSTTCFAPPRAKSPRRTASERHAAACSFQKFGEEPFFRLRVLRDGATFSKDLGIARGAAVAIRR